MNVSAPALAPQRKGAIHQRMKHESEARGKQTFVQALSQNTSCACGGSCPRCQAKTNSLNISQPHDPAEIEADQIADKVMRMPSAGSTSLANNKNHLTTLRQKSSSSEDGKKSIKRKALPSSSTSLSKTPAHIGKVLSSSGQRLDQETRSFFEPRLGYDLGGVRIHANSVASQSARAIDARAYTLGNNIVFAESEYRPDSKSGKQLLAHELAHVVQQPRTNEKIHRAARGAAGGCGICMNDPGGKEAGKIAHAEIQMAFAAGNPDIVAEYAIPVVEPGAQRPFVPEVDLSYVTQTKSQKTISIGEIKPLDDAGKQVGIAREKLKDYARELKANPDLHFDEVVRMTDSPPAGPIPFFNPSHPLGCPPQMIYVKMTEPGIYQYYCEPPFPTLVKDLRCICKKKDDEEEKKVVEVAKSQGDVKSNQEEKNDKKIKPETGLPPYVVPAAIGAGVSVAAAAYLRKKAIEQAEKRAAQLAWRKMAEAAAARRAAAAAGKGVAGKAVGKAVVYVEIAAAAALIILYPDRVEAKPGPGPSAIESLYKAMTTNGSPPSPEMKALIESDPILKQLAEEAGSSGDGSKLQEEMALRTLEMIKNNPDIFTPEDLEFLAQYSKTAKTAQAPKTAEELRQAIDAAKAGKTGSGSDGKGSGDGKSTTAADTPPATKPDEDKPAGGTQGNTSQPGGKSNTGDKTTGGDTPQPGATATPGQDNPKFSKLNDESKKRITEAPPQVGKLFREFSSGQKDDLKLDDEVVKMFFDIVPKDLTEKQVETLIDGLSSSHGKTIDEAMQLLKTAIDQVKKSDAAAEGSSENPGTPTTPLPTDSPPAKTKDQIIAELAAIAKKWDFSKIPDGQVRIQDGAKKVTGNRMSTYIYGKVNGVGVVGYISGTIPDGVDVSKLKKGDSFTITITSQSPFVDKGSRVRNFKMGSTFTISK